MEKESNSLLKEITQSEYKYGFTSDIEMMKHEHISSKEEPNSMILLNCLDKKVVLIVLRTGTGLRSFQSNDSVTIQVIVGLLTYHSHKETVILSKDQFLTLDEKIDYSLTTNEETVILLTIANSSLLYSEN